MTAKEIYESIDLAQVPQDLATKLRQIEKATKGFTIQSDKIDTFLRGVYAKLKEKKPTALKNLKVEEKIVKTEVKTGDETQVIEDLEYKVKGTKNVTRKTPTPSEPKRKENPQQEAKRTRKKGETAAAALARVMRERKEAEKMADGMVSKTSEALKELEQMLQSDPKLAGYPRTYGNQSKRIDAKKDAQIKAMPAGKRVSKKGHKNQYGPSKGGRVYWENRDNRSDRFAPNFPNKVFLAVGGELDDLGFPHGETYIVVDVSPSGDKKIIKSTTDYLTAMMSAAVARSAKSSKDARVLIVGKDSKKVLHETFEAGGEITITPYPLVNNPDALVGTTSMTELFECGGVTAYQEGGEVFVTPYPLTNAGSADYVAGSNTMSNMFAKGGELDWLDNQDEVEVKIGSKTILFDVVEFNDVYVFDPATEQDEDKVDGLEERNENAVVDGLSRFLRKNVKGVAFSHDENHGGSGFAFKTDEKFAKGGYVAVSEKDGYWFIVSQPTSKEEAQQMIDMGVPRGEMGKVVTLDEAKAYKKVIGREYLEKGGSITKDASIDKLWSKVRNASKKTYEESAGYVVYLNDDTLNIGDYKDLKLYSAQADSDGKVSVTLIKHPYSVTFTNAVDEKIEDRSSYDKYGGSIYIIEPLTESIAKLLLESSTLKKYEKGGITQGGKPPKNIKYYGVNEIKEYRLKNGDKIDPSKTFVDSGVYVSATKTMKPKEEVFQQKLEFKKGGATNWKGEKINWKEDYIYIPRYEIEEVVLDEDLHNGKVIQGDYVVSGLYLPKSDRTKQLEKEMKARMKKMETGGTIVAADPSAAMGDLSETYGFESVYEKGGRLGFAGLARKVAKRYEGKAVPKKYQQEYGKTYSKAESLEVGRKVAAKVFGQQQAMMEAGGEITTPYPLTNAGSAEYVAGSNTMSNMFAQGGSLMTHGLKVGDKIVKDLGYVLKVANEDGDMVYIDLANGYRGAEPPLPFEHGGGVMIGDIAGLAKKYNKSGHEVVMKIGEGEKVEMEHTENPKVARKIALDHIAEDWDYYAKLKKLGL
jgi:nitrogen fixation protein